MIRIIQFGVLFLVLVVLSNCKSGDPDLNVFINVDDDFYIDLFEDISNQEGLFYINIQSIQDQECENAIIDYSLDIDLESDNFIILSINDILEPETCIGENAPAFVSVPIGKLKNESYEIQINLKDAIINKGTLTVSSEDYFLGMSSQNGIELLNMILYKIPENTIWGYVGYEEETQQDDAETFIKELETFTSNQNFTDAFGVGYFGYFSILDDRSVTIQEDITDKNHSNFVFYNELRTTTEIDDFIQDYCENHPTLNIHLFDHTGNEITCQ